MTTLLLVAGLILLIAGGELLVRGAVRVALASGISPLIIGLTVVAFGTSAPELAVSLFAALRGSADVAIGNVIGSNIFNVLFILGISALLVPLVVSRQLIRIDVPLMVAVSVLFLAFAWNRVIGRGEAVALLACLVAYIAVQIRISRREPVPVAPADQPRETRWVRDIGYLVVGLVLLTLGSRWLVQGAVTLARNLGVTELMIGLTVVAPGTSLPEVATSIIAGLRGQRDIAVGNVIGSNIFNLLAVTGVTALVTAGGIPVTGAAATVDIPVMIAVAALCLPIFFSGHVISRWEGLLFISYFLLYFTYLFLDASEHNGANQYGDLVLTVVVPVTVITVGLFTLRSWRTQRPHP